MSKIGLNVMSAMAKETCDSGSSVTACFSFTSQSLMGVKNSQMTCVSSRAAGAELFTAIFEVV